MFGTDDEWESRIPGNGDLGKRRHMDDWSRIEENVLAIFGPFLVLSSVEFALDESQERTKLFLTKPSNESRLVSTRGLVNKEQIFKMVGIDERLGTKCTERLSGYNTVHCNKKQICLRTLAKKS